MITTYRKALTWGRTQLASVSVIETPQLDALILLCHCAKITKERYFTEPDAPFDQTQYEYYRRLITERAACKPVAYCINKREFFNLEFYVDERVLVPRPETELLVEQALSFLSVKPGPTRVLDMCTGSGCVGISIAHTIPDAEVLLTDISQGALEVARKNCTTILQKDLEIMKSDIFSALEGRRFHLIVANPPYLSHTWLTEVGSQVRQEPESALLGGGPDGLDTIRRIVSDACLYLEDNGALIVECDGRQVGEIELLFRMSGFIDIFCKRDLAGIGRIVGGKRSCTRN
ncbi:MAG: peptide chain release factor N(5)-glutamine methyltransferase [Spirochaetales bacterium]|nr:peptide chain release factor N(5)-glutamine methyltransferase [Spirochaetales bacterium]